MEKSVIMYETGLDPSRVIAWSNICCSLMVGGMSSLLEDGRMRIIFGIFIKKSPALFTFKEGLAMIV